MSSLQVDNIQTYNSNPPVIKNVSGTEVGTFCRAWVNFNGTGVVAIRASGNVSSITDNGTGDYTVNFTTAMPDANFVITTSASELGSTGIADWYVTAGRATNYSDLYSTTLCKVEAVSGGGANVDPGVVNVAIFR